MLLKALSGAFLLCGCVQTAPRGTVPTVSPNGTLQCPIDASESVDDRGNPICITPKPLGPTLLIDNQGLDQIRVADYLGRIATVMPGEKKCVAMVRRYTSNISLFVSAVGDSATTPSFFPEEAPGWVMEISSMPLRFSVISLQPAEPCIPKS